MLIDIKMKPTFTEYLVCTGQNCLFLFEAGTVILLYLLDGETEEQRGSVTGLKSHSCGKVADGGQAQH